MPRREGMNRSLYRWFCCDLRDDGGSLVSEDGSGEVEDAAGVELLFDSALSLPGASARLASIPGQSRPPTNGLGEADSLLHTY